jgi:outer membrane protein assembly factor BamB
VLWSTQLEGGWVDAVAAQDLDFDGRSEVFAATNDTFGGFPGRVHALSREGQLQWSVEVGRPVTHMLFVDVDQDGAVELILTTGLELSEPGDVLAVRLGADVPEAERILWRHALPLPAQNLTLGTVDGQLVVLMGAMDARVHALVPATGEEAWTYGAGSFVLVTAAGDVDGDGLDEVVRGDDQGLVSVHAPASGHALWTHRVEAPGGAAVTDVATGDLDGDGRAEVVVSGLRYGMLQEPSLVQAFRADGSLLFSRALPSWNFELAVADLDGDGRSEVLLSEGREDGGCGIRALAADGEPLWRTRAAPSCDVPTLDVGHVDGDDLPDVGYADLSTFSLRHVALLAADGTLLWSRERFNDGMWVRVVRGGLLYGGWADDYFGHVTRVEAQSGEVEWEQLFEPFADPETPGIPNGSGVQGGALVADRDGDGVEEVAVGTHSGQVHLLDGATGGVKWTRTLTNLDARSIARHGVGAGVAWVPATETQPSYVAVGLQKGVRSRGELHVLRTDTGAPVGRVDTSGNSYAACVGRFTTGAQAGVAFGAGLSVYALEVAPAP